MPHAAKNLPAMEAATTNTHAINYQHLLNALPGLYLILCPELNILDATEAYLQGTLTKREEIIGRYIFDVFPENQATSEARSGETLRHSLTHVLTLRTPHTMPVLRYDIPLPAALGGGFEERYWLTSHTPVLDPAGEILYIVQKVVDVTMQQLAHRDIRANRERFELLALATSDAVWDWDLLSNHLWWNSTFQDIFGYETHQIDDIWIWSEKIHPEDQKRVKESIHQVVSKSGKSWSDTYRFRRANGTYATVLDRGFTLRDENGNAYRMVGTLLDISRQIQAELELKESKNQFQNLIESLPCPAWTNTSEGVTTYLNKAWYDFTGMEPGNFERTFSYFHPDDVAPMFALWDECRPQGSVYEIEFRIRSREGDYQWFLARSVPLIDSENRVTLWLGTCINIHEQKLQQQKLLARESYLDRILKVAPVHLAVLKGADLMVEYLSPGFQKLHASPVEGQPLAIAIPELADQGYHAIIQAVYRTGEPYYGREMPLLVGPNANGLPAEVFFNVTYQPLQNTAGQTEGVIVTASDVTKQVKAKKQVEELYWELQKSNERIVQILEAQPLMTWTALPDGQINYYNQRWYEYTGATFEESKNFGWQKFIHPADLAETQDKWNSALQTGNEYVHENRWRSAQNGTYNWFLERGVPIRNQHGEITFWIGSLTNIQEQKALLSELLEAKEKFEFLADTIPQLVWTTDANGIHDYFNKRLAEYIGYTLEESYQVEWLTHIHPNDREQCNNAMQHALRTGTYYEAEFRIRSKTGTYRCFLGQALPVRNEAGRIIKWFGTCTDIEDHKKAAEELKTKNAELRKINQDLDSFVYTASHDLKMPIINIETIFGDLIRAAEFHDPDADKLISHFQKSLKQIYGTIDDLSQVVKVQRNLDDGRDFVDLKEITKAIKTSIKELISSTTASIKTDFKEAPAIWFSKPNLKSVIYNLITNSIKYGAKDRAPIIRLKSSPAGEYTLLTVTDNGIGIDLNRHSEKLFQMYRRFHNHVPGTGLGLYIVHRIMANNGGRIELESSINQGTTFRLYFKNKPPVL
ncbi:PAS domain-containing sensor histidine kinase [Adhaeribacter soli]|uniref:histidine kinase n=1 Tax=Adhaeribacter soli TaxID=2607655 RepID=A0A5N1INC3_9BACT|nr:PAS domain-containing sensor histidine kinase [Adhaeribacter soli]KAA9324980.1 PAS domain-containing sensor histidine kinase [Adhaeribacter soli]